MNDADSDNEVRFFHSDFPYLRLYLVGYDYDISKWRKMSPQRFIEYLEEQELRKAKGWNVAKLKSGDYLIY